MTDAERKTIKDDLKQLQGLVRDISSHISNMIAMVGMSESDDETRTKVYCTFDECLHYKPHSDIYGICTNDCIILDEQVSGRTCGCPDAEWNESKPKTAYYCEDCKHICVPFNEWPCVDCCEGDRRDDDGE